MMGSSTVHPSMNESDSPNPKSVMGSLMKKLGRSSKAPPQLRQHRMMHELKRDISEIEAPRSESDSGASTHPLTDRSDGTHSSSGGSTNSKGTPTRTSVSRHTRYRPEAGGSVSCIRNEALNNAIAQNTNTDSPVSRNSYNVAQAGCNTPKTHPSTPTTPARHNRTSARKPIVSASTRQLGELVPTRVLGTGGFGSAVLVHDRRNGRRYALKAVPKTRLRANAASSLSAQTERKILELVTHPFIVEYYGAMQDETHIYYLLGYCSGGDLANYLCRYGSLKLSAVKFFISEIISAVQDMHKKNLVVRDIKPENILLDGLGHVRLTDFGLSKLNVSSWIKGATTLCGTEPYVGPEVFQWPSYGQAVDMWAIGMMMYEMITGGDFDAMKRAANCEAGVDALMQHTKRTVGSKGDEGSLAVDFLRATLQRSPYRRLGANGGEEVRSHAYFRGVDWVNLAGRSPPFKPLIQHQEAETPDVRHIVSGNGDADMSSSGKVSSAAAEASTRSPRVRINIQAAKTDERFEGFIQQGPGSPVNNFLTLFSKPATTATVVNAEKSQNSSQIDSSKGTKHARKPADLTIKVDSPRVRDEFNNFSGSGEMVVVYDEVPTVWALAKNLTVGKSESSCSLHSCHSG